MALPDLAYRLIGWYSTTRINRVVHPLLYRLTGARGVASRVLGADQILVSAPGRRTGRPRTVVLFAFPAHGGWIVVGSRGGSGRVPGWAHNLRASGWAFVRDRDRTVTADVRELDGPEYEAAFERAAAVYPGYRLYRRNARHRIPIFRLEPVPSTAAPDASTDGVGGATDVAPPVDPTPTAGTPR
ncbi:MAG TPA: nitroreductase family deazaflavin-dependent oxidoreductase [Candidatus Binatia bacterium]|nr:nitroreductase family deazaflavin-dependent oxidoreductase [Candidatus Binatia bacterium]